MKTIIIVALVIGALDILLIIGANKLAKEKGIKEVEEKWKIEN